MNKAPAFQFYVADYMQDTRCLSLAAKGAWTDCLCAMWRSLTKGKITYPMIGYARLFGCTVEQAQAVINELVEMQICDSVTHGDGKVTLINRRMQREAKERESANNRQNRYRQRLKRQDDNPGDGESDEDVTSYSSSSSSSSSTNNLRSGGGGSLRAREGSPPAAASTESSKNRQWSELTAEEKQMDLSTFKAHLQSLHPDKNVPGIAEKLTRFFKQINRNFELAHLKGWVEGERQTVTEAEFLETFAKEPFDEAEFFKRKYGGKKANGS